MPSIHGENDNDGPKFDRLAQFYISVAILWTTTLIAGCTYLVLNRHEQCIRIRNLLLALSAIACLHVYWILCMVAYSMGDKYPCAAEYWIMSIYLPFGIALFQANSMQLLNVFGIQDKLLRGAQQPYRPPFLGRVKPLRRQLSQWRHMNLVQRTEVCIVIGIVIQLCVSLSIFLSSRKFESFGTFSQHVGSEQCRRGPEWIPSILWQLTWSWLFAPYILWRIRNIHDIHHWRLQITCCVIASLPGSPLWLAALYSPTSMWATINTYWVPALWFAPGIMTMEAVTIFVPCYELIVSRRQRNRVLRELQAWSERRISASTKLESSGVSQSRSEVSQVSQASHLSGAYSRKALDACLAEDSSALLRFAAAKEFSGENIIFLNYVRDWKAAWTEKTARQPEYNWQLDSQHHRLRLFQIAVEIYAACIDINIAEFPINIESRIYSDLSDLFGAFVQFVDQPVSGSTRARSYEIPGECYNMLPKYRETVTVQAVDEDNQALCPSPYPHETQSIMHIQPRVPDSVDVPPHFGFEIFDQAERSIKNLVYTNTWPKFIGSSSENLSIRSI